MQGTKVATRYAKSLFDLALEKGEIEKVCADMKLVQQVCSTSPDFVAMLTSPIIKTDKKQAIIHSVFDKQLSKVSLAFVDIIVKKKREMFLPEIAEAFAVKYKEHKKILTAVITTAFGIDETLRKQVIEVIKGATKSEIELVEKVDTTLIGGFIVRVGDKQDDTSIRTKIMKLSRIFKENPYIKEF